MEVFEINEKLYNNIFEKTYHVFNSVAFNDLNRNICNELKYLVFKDTKYRLGLIIGITEKNAKSPFSAPFGAFSFIKEDVKIEQIDNAIDSLILFLKKNKIFKLTFVLPPMIYNESFISKMISSMYRKHFNIVAIDVNYHFEVNDFHNYNAKLKSSSKRALKTAIKANLFFKKCETLNEIKMAYSVIKKNREEQGYPLRMSIEQVIKTIKIINSDFFLVYDINKQPVASAQIFYVSDNTVQIIYWGHILKYSNFKPLNFLSYKIFEYYSKTNFKYIDIGPSSENSIPNYGLCAFKESIGCKISQKFAFKINI